MADRSARIGGLSKGRMREVFISSQCNLMDDIIAVIGNGIFISDSKKTISLLQDCLDACLDMRLDLLYMNKKINREGRDTEIDLHLSVDGLTNQNVDQSFMDLLLTYVAQAKENYLSNLFNLQFSGHMRILIWRHFWHLKKMSKRLSGFQH